LSGPSINRKKPLAILVDLETVSLSMNRQFMEIIQNSRARGERDGGIAADEVERKFGHRPNAGDE
jgi:hypothetical protein